MVGVHEREASKITSFDNSIFTTSGRGDPLFSSQRRPGNAIE